MCWRLGQAAGSALGPFGAKTLKDKAEAAIADVEAALAQPASQGLPVETGQTDRDIAGGVRQLAVDRRGLPNGIRAGTTGLGQQKADIEQIPYRLGFGPLLPLQARDFAGVVPQESRRTVLARPAALSDLVQGAARCTRLFAGLGQSGEAAQHDRQDGVARAAVRGIAVQVFQRTPVPVLDQAAGVNCGGHEGASFRVVQREREGAVAGLAGAV